jgi:hypothetical protein
MRCALLSFIPPYTATSGPYTVVTAEARAYKLYTRQSPLSMMHDIFSRVEGSLTSLTLDIIDKDHDMWDADARQRAEFEDFRWALREEIKAYVRSHRMGVESEERGDLMGGGCGYFEFFWRRSRVGRGWVLGKPQVVEGMGKGEEAVH